MQDISDYSWNALLASPTIVAVAILVQQERRQGTDKSCLLYFFDRICCRASDSTDSVLSRQRRQGVTDVFCLLSHIIFSYKIQIQRTLIESGLPMLFFSVERTCTHHSYPFPQQPKIPSLRKQTCQHGSHEINLPKVFSIKKTIRLKTSKNDKMFLKCL